ncbi:hypothetical protein A2U01_0004759, partial [Trifolium medium]|nr:hypothetical protein [Trifolium medium]
ILWQEVTLPLLGFAEVEIIHPNGSALGAFSLAHWFLKLGFISRVHDIPPPIDRDLVLKVELGVSQL